LVASIFLQWVKDGWDYLGDLDQFFHEHWASFNYMNLVAPWVEEFGEDSIISRVYDPALIGSNVTQNFLSLVGLDHIAATNERLNPSLLPEFVPTIIALDNAGIDPRTRRDAISKLLDVSVQLASASRGGLVSPATEKRIRRIYSESNAEFAQRFLPDAHRPFLCRRINDAD
jgi:hypothetical protein